VVAVVAPCRRQVGGLPSVQLAEQVVGVDIEVRGLPEALEEVVDAVVAHLPVQRLPVKRL
jgi:hypothetical protein